MSKIPDPPIYVDYGLSFETQEEADAYIARE